MGKYLTAGHFQTLGKCLIASWRAPTYREEDKAVRESNATFPQKGGKAGPRRALSRYRIGTARQTHLFPCYNLGCHAPTPLTAASRRKRREENAGIFQKDPETPQIARSLQACILMQWRSVVICCNYLGVPLILARLD